MVVDGFKVMTPSDKKMGSDTAIQQPVSVLVDDDVFYLFLKK
jgi:hypothetical protein